MKDNFSTQADSYARFRPQYPQAMIDHLLKQVADRNSCWDCGTGNGQFAAQLSPYFKKICATDISKQQLGNAVRKSNIEYSLQPAEKTHFPDQSFDLIVAAQAAHWFNFDAFNPEVKRLLKPEGVVALFGYGLVQVSGKAGAVIRTFYWEVTKPFWDPERDHIEAKYETIPFPFAEVDSPSVNIESELTRDELLGYIGTWSAVQHFKSKHGYSPTVQLRSDLEPLWPKEVRKKIVFPMFYRIGKNT